MPIAYNRTLTPLPADAEGRMIAGRSEGEVDDSYPAVERAISEGALKIVGDSEAGPSGSSGEKKKTSAKSTKKKTSSSKKADEPDEEN